MTILVVGPVDSLVDMRHQERTDRVFTGVRNIWCGGGTWLGLSKVGDLIDSPIGDV